MRELCRFVEIEFRPTHMKPTLAGMLWAGNNFEGREFDGVSAHGVRAWRERMPDEFAMIMEHGREEQLRNFSYEPSFANDQSQDAMRDFGETIAGIDRRALLAGYDERLFAVPADLASETAPTTSTSRALTA